MSAATAATPAPVSAATTPTPVSAAAAAATPAPVSAAATPTPVSTAATTTPAPVSTTAAATPPPVLYLIDGVDDGGSIIDRRTACWRGRSARCPGHTDARDNKRCNQDGSHSSSPFLLLCVPSLPCHTRNHDERVLKHVLERALRRAACSSNSDQKRSRPDRKNYGTRGSFLVMSAR